MAFISLIYKFFAFLKDIVREATHLQIIPHNNWFAFFLFASLIVFAELSWLPVFPTTQ